MALIAAVHEGEAAAGVSANTKTNPARDEKNENVPQIRCFSPNSALISLLKIVPKGD